MGLTFGASLLAQGGAAPPDPATAATIYQLFRLTKPERLIDQMLQQYRAAFAQGFKQNFDKQVRDRGGDPINIKLLFRSSKTSYLGF